MECASTRDVGRMRRRETAGKGDRIARAERFFALVETYTSSKWGWSIQYPPAWFDLPNFGAPDTVKGFATEDVQSPLGLSEHGLWLNIETFAQSCEPRYKGEIVEETPITVGSSSTKYIVRGPDSDAAFAGAVSVTATGRCYALGFLASNRETLDANAHLIREIIKTFRV